VADYAAPRGQDVPIAMGSVASLFVHRLGPRPWAPGPARALSI
jgi:hypothetical protein